ncbi:MAG: hypothetical protein D6744_11920, partial [Planctomycetota bacterium]
INRTIIKPLQAHPEDGLLGAVTMIRVTPRDAIRYLDKNGLDVNVLTEWTQAGIVMFYAPRARVYMDGRAQQVYDEAHYNKYTSLFLGRDIPRQHVTRLLNEHNTEVVFARKSPRNLPLMKALTELTNEWAPILDDPMFIMFMRIGSPKMQRLRDLVDSGQEWRPNTPEARFSLGTLVFRTNPPDVRRAMQLWRSAIAQKPVLGITGYYYVTLGFLASRDLEAGRQFFEQEIRKIRSLQRQLDPQQGAALLKSAQMALAEINKRIEQRKQQRSP